MSMQALQELVGRWMAPSGGLAALAAALDVKAGGPPLDPAVARRVGEMLDALGASELLRDVSPEQAATLRSFIRAMLLLDAKLLFPHWRTAGWSHAEPEILQSLGEASRMHAVRITRELVPACEGLADRLRSPGAAMLDVGVGVAMSAIAMAQMWPAMRVLGVDPWAPSIRLARENVERAGLAQRIELREQGVEALDEEAAFDYCWYANNFIPEAHARAGLTRVHRALRPGGWVSIGANNDSAPAPLAALFRLRETQWGGPVWNEAEAEAALREAGFVEVQTMPTPPGAPVSFVLGRAAPA